MGGIAEPGVPCSLPMFSNPEGCSACLVSP